MKNSLIALLGCFILGVCMVLSSILLSNSISNLSRQNHIINGSLGVSQSNTGTENENEYLAVGDVARLLGYDSIEAFSKDVLNGNLRDLPYINVNGLLIFSKTAFDDWLIESAKLNKDLSKK